MEIELKPLKVAFLWHQHQPNYKHPSKNVFILPWVRLHALKDYFDMVAILEDYPEIHQNVNLVPSMLKQLCDYVEANCQDRIEILTRKKPGELSELERAQILKYFFQANWKNQVEIYPGFRRLLNKRGRKFNVDHRQPAFSKFTDQDFLDLQVWYNLSWVGEIHKKQEPYKSLINKDRGFTQEDKLNLLESQQKFLSKIVEKHKELSRNGQIELSTTPFYHPILPLLCDSTIARESQPEIQLPNHQFFAPEDASEQIIRAIHFHEELFGEKPQGMWPSEGSVSEEVAELFASNNINWIATDEEVLFSTWRKLNWHNKRREDLHQAWQFNAGGKPINVFFRDHELSDLIGFVYQNWDAEQAADDFIVKLKNIRKRILRYSGEKKLDQAIVSVILDGENCWEFYEQNGRPFLQALYHKLSTAKELKSVTFSQHLTESPKNEILPKLFPGSWINHNFAIWIGHPEDNKAWDYLYEARQAIIDAEKNKSCSDDILSQAKEEIMIAEGSDWCWWYGDDHVNENADEFDEIFRSHLIKVYELLHIDVPIHLYKSIRKQEYKKNIITEPIGFISPRIDGADTNYFEWLGSGVFDTKNHGDSMHQMAQFVETIGFGFDLQHIYLKVITEPIKVADVLEEYDAEICIFKPKPLNVHVNLGSLINKGINSGLSIRKNGESISQPNELKAAFKTFLEMKIPLHCFSGIAGDNVHFQVKIYRNQKIIEKWPKEELIVCEIPGPEFEKEEWRV